MKRFDEFGRYVHPVLQTHCARCHNDRYEGSFQLISFKSKVDRTPAALRANLDATLRLVDRDNPAHSELLSSSLRPHGRGPNPRPIFKGSNDGAYQILATWINRLQGRKTAAGVVPASMTSTPRIRGRPSPAGVDRSPATPDPAAPPVKPFVTGPVEHKSLPPMRAIRASMAWFPRRTPIPTSSPFPLRSAAAGPREPAPLQNPTSARRPCRPPRSLPCPPSNRDDAHRPRTPRCDSDADSSGRRTRPTPRRRSPVNRSSSTPRFFRKRFS